MIVYHYCSLDVFTKIISGKSIRLSDITKSNDSMEILWITKYIEAIFDEEFQKETEKTKYFKEDYREGYLQKSSIFLLVPEMKKAEDISITRLDYVLFNF